MKNTNPQIRQKMKNFSQTMYVAMFALSIMRKNLPKEQIKQKELSTSILSLLENSSSIIPEALMPPKKMGPESITLNSENPIEVYNLAVQKILELLVVGQTTLLEECLNIRFPDIKEEKLFNKMKMLSFPQNTKESWSIEVVSALRIMRNSIIHNDGIWDKEPFPQDKKTLKGTPIKLTFDDIFRFRRAVRTYVNTVILKSNSSTSQ